MLQQITNCPVCKGTDFAPFLNCKDYTVSQESFNIVSCKACNFKFTNPRPSDSEIGKYYKSEDYVSHSDTKKGLINRLYHMVRTRTLKQKLDLISSYVSRGTILDYGCGTGMFLKTCADAGWKSFGFEPDSDAKKLAEGKGLSVANSKEALAGNKYDIISLWHVLEHVTDLDPTLEFFSKSITDKGRLIIAVPNYTSADAKYYKEFWAGYDVPRHIYHFEINTLKKLLGNYGFSLEETKPMKFDSYYVSMLSEKYKTGSMNYFTAFLNGLKSNLAAKDSSQYSSVIYIFKKA
ncbi:MAG: class I SAM-dependent methyltransferase [Bacteroidia bacterium]|nr:class I SAM-dependent methyltransferase [Bacteroidia bacterium]